jgi:hypothetical protein
MVKVETDITAKNSVKTNSKNLDSSFCAEIETI